MGRYPLRTAIGEYMAANKGYLAEATLAERQRKLNAFAKRFERLSRQDPSLEPNPANWGEKEITTILVDSRKRNWALSTQAKEVENIQALLRFVGNGIVDKLKSAKPHLFPRRTSVRGSSLDENQLSAVMDAAEEIDGWTGEVARFLVATYAYTGLRPGELRKADFSDLDTQNWTLRVRHPKGESNYGDHRVVAIPGPLRPAAIRYLRARERMLADKGLLDVKPLVCRSTSPDKHYSSNHFRRIKKTVQECSGVSFELRALRRTYGQRLLDRGVSLESVSLALGHSSTLTTERYYCRKDADSARLEVLRAFGNVGKGSECQFPLIESKTDYTGYA